MDENVMLDCLRVVWNAAVLSLAVVSWALVARKLIRRSKDSCDPKRMFTNAERQEGFARAGNQCEYARWLVFRCTRTATHADHIIPWSKGGGTTLSNFAAACARCNTSKGARMPSRFARLMLQARRRQYFPAGTPRTAGDYEWAVRR